MPHPFKGELGRGFCLRVLAFSNAFRSWFTHIRCYQLRCQGTCKLTTKGYFNPFGFYFCKWNSVEPLLRHLATSATLPLFCSKRDSGNSPEEKAFVLYLDSRLPWIATNITPATSRMLCSWVGYMALWYPRRRGHGQWGLNWRIVLIHLQENCNWCRGTTVRNKIVRTD